MFRRVPSVLDVLYSVFNNDQTVSELSKRMQGKAEDIMVFRDGFEYQNTLIALRKVMDDLPQEMWESSVYFQWLATLRCLSYSPDEIKENAKFYSNGAPNDVACPLPQVVLTSAWQDRVMNTQCASWTELRHDTILYVKQSFSCGLECEYPAGYVEPNLPFWRQMLKMATNTAEIMKKTEIFYWRECAI